MTWAHWDEVEHLVLSHPAGQDVHLLKGALPHPLEVGMDRAIGIPKGGSFKHFRQTVRGVSCLHVREYQNHYEVHWDRVDPRMRPLGHWWHDVRGGKTSLVAAMGLLTGLAALPFL